MHKRTAWIVIALICLTASAPTRAQWRREKWELVPFVGYETSGSFPITNSLGVDRLRTNANVSYGTFVDYTLTDSAQFEFMWNRNPTTYSEHQIATGQYVKAFDSKIDQFQFGLLYMFRGSDTKLRPYIAGGLGFTRDWNSGATANRTAFSFGLGGGVKYMVDKYFGLRADARFMPTYANSSPGVYCDIFGFCYPATTPNYLKRGNFTGGLIFRF
jgi:outer membrane protein with beta-barrel domain